MAKVATTTKMADTETIVAGVLQVQSNASSQTYEEGVEARGEPHWFQIYTNPDWNRNQRVIDRVASAGCPTLVWTIDLLGGSNRELLRRSLVGEGRESELCQQCHEHQEGYQRPMNRDLGGPAGERPPYTWDWVSRLKDASDMNLVVKGIVTAEEAELAIEHGADGIYVSNHGGRAVNSLWSTIDALPEVVAAVRGRVPVMIDSGVRRGGDVFKALALGADAVGEGVLHPVAVPFTFGRKSVTALAVRPLATQSERAAVLEAAPPSLSAARSRPDPSTSWMQSMKNLTKSFAWALIAAAPFLLSSGSSLSAQDASPLSLTEEVHTAGQAAYETACEACHLATFGGSFEAPELAGPNFRAFWTERTLAEFRATVRTMPPTTPNSLRDAEYDAITVYLLSANGLERDGRVVQADRETTVGSMLTGAVAEVSAAADAGTRFAAADNEPSVPSGVTRTFREITDFEPVTEQELLNPDDEDWLIFRRTYDSQGFSPLDQINRSNVADMRLAWVWAMADGTNQPTPLVHDGVMYLANPGNVIQALDAAEGTLLWEYRRQWADDYRSPPLNQLRNLAIYGERIFVPTKDAYMVALDARTGETVWESQIADYHQGFTNSSGALVVEGKVLNGISGCTRFFEESCFITAHDAATGEEVWRTFTIARPGEPGGDSWGDLPLELRGGVDVWNTGSYDPELGLVYWGTAQAKPWVAASRGLTVDDAALYSNSTLAIDPDDGSIVWYNQHVPGESHDLDEAFERVLIDSNGQRLVFSMGKHGILWKLDRETGEVLGS